MKVVYELPVRQGVEIPAPNGAPSISVDDIEIIWKLYENVSLCSVHLVFKGIELRQDQDGSIISSFPELEERAFKVSTFIANSVFLQTGIDAFDPFVFLHRYPQTFPETQEETVKFSKLTIKAMSHMSATMNIVAKFDPQDYAERFRLSAALASYAEGIRVNSLFIKYEQFYKVIEHFFSENGQALDVVLSSYVQQFDFTFDNTTVEKLRHLRNRCIHPRAHQGHVNPEEMASIAEVRAVSPDLQRLVQILLNNPPN